MASCDIVEPPFEDAPTTTTNPTDTTNRMVLVEDFTGFKCPNCPEASHLLHTWLEGKYKDKIIVVGIHAGILAKPNGSGLFITDYRTPVGTELWTAFQLDHIPVASINRTLESGVHWMEKGVWDGRIADEVAKAPEVDLTITTTFNDASRLLSVSVENEFLVAGTAKENLIVYLIEDNIIDVQDSVGIHILDYNHRNVLRGSLNTTWGENLSTTSITAGSKITKSYTYTVPANYNINNCSIVAFVHNDDTKVVRQAAQKAIKP